MKESVLLQDYCIYCHNQITYHEGESHAFCPVCRADIAVIHFRGYRDERVELKAELQKKQKQIEAERQQAENAREVFLREKKTLQAEQERIAKEKSQAENRVKELLHNLNEMGQLGQVMNAVAGKQKTDGEKLEAITFLARKLLDTQNDFAARFALINDYVRTDVEIGQKLYSLAQASGAEQSAQLNKILQTGSSIQSGLSAANGKLDELNGKLSGIGRSLKKSEDALRSLKAQGEENSKKLDGIAGSINRVQQTLDENKENKYNELREIYLEANRLKARHRFDEAYRKYQSAIEKGGKDILNPAELHWRKLQCRYGVEYVWSDYDKGAKPTLYRIGDLTPASQTEEAKDVLTACADAGEKNHYHAELLNLDGIIRRYKDVHYDQQFDVFISVKQQDGGSATTDSDRARALWNFLTKKGLNVFNSAITSLPAGENYEPYILSAMRSAKTMVVVAGKPEYMTAPWVKNEWGRFLWMKENEDKERKLIPFLFGGMKPNQMPGEIQSRNIQAIQEGIGSDEKLLSAIVPEKTAVPASAASVPQNRVNGRSASVSHTGPVSSAAVPQNEIYSGPNTQSLLKRVFIYLEDGDWYHADQYCEKVLDISPEEGQAYLGKLMSELHVKKEQNLQDQEQPFDDKANYQKAIRFGGAGLREKLANDNKIIRDRIEYNKQYSLYREACAEFDKCTSIYAYRNVKRNLEALNRIPEAKTKIAECDKKCKSISDSVYKECLNDYNKYSGKSALQLEAVSSKLQEISEDARAAELAGKCKSEAKAIRGKLYAEAYKLVSVAQNQPERWNEVIPLLSNPEIRGYRNVDELLNTAKKNRPLTEEEKKKSEEEKKSWRRYERSKRRDERLGKFRKVLTVLLPMLIVAALAYVSYRVLRLTEDIGYLIPQFAVKPDEKISSLWCLLLAAGLFGIHMVLGNVDFFDSAIWIWIRNIVLFSVVLFVVFFIAENGTALIIIVLVQIILSLIGIFSSLHTWFKDKLC